MLCSYLKRFKAKKAKIIGCDYMMANVAFKKRFPAEHPLFGELILGEELTMVNTYALE